MRALSATSKKVKDIIEQILENARERAPKERGQLLTDVFELYVMKRKNG